MIFKAIAAAKLTAYVSAIVAVGAAIPFTVATIIAGRLLYYGTERFAQQVDALGRRK